MKHNDSLFDELVRMKLQQRSFGPADEGWEKMQELLPAERKRAVVGLRTTILACLLAAVAGGSLVFLLRPRHDTIRDAEAAGAVYAATTHHRSAASIAGHNAQQPAAPGIVDLHKQERASVGAGEKENAAEHRRPAAANTDRISQQPVSNPGLTKGNEPTQQHSNELSATSGNDAPETNNPSAALQPSLLHDPLLAPERLVQETPDGMDSVSMITSRNTSANYWSVQVGVAYSAPFLAGTSSARSFSPVIGIGYNVWLNPQWSVQTGLRYSCIGNVAGIGTATANESAPGFVEYTGSRLQRLHYLSLPVQAWRRVGNRHAIGAGYTLSFLAATQRRTYFYTETNGTISNEQHSSAFSRDGLSSFDGLLTLGYSFALRGRMQVEASAYTGVTDMLYNSTYGNRFERNRGVLLLVHYSF